MQRSAAEAILMARRPMERTALRTKSTSTSEAYLRDERRVQRGSNHARKPCALFEFGEDLLDVALVGETVDDFKLGELDVDGVVVLAKEDLDVVFENERATLDNEVDVAKGDVLDFVARGEEGDYAALKGSGASALPSRRLPTYRAVGSACGTSPQQSPESPCSS